MSVREAEGSSRPEAAHDPEGDSSAARTLTEQTEQAGWG